MKKLNLIIGACLCLMSSISYSQETFTTYESLAAQKTYEIQIGYENNKFILFVYAYSFDNTVEIGGFLIPEEKLEGFLDNLKQAKLKYEEWDSVAKVNKVTSLEKVIDIKSQSLRGFFLYGDKYYYDRYLDPIFVFRVIESDGKIISYLLVTSNKLTANDNEYITCKGFGLAFFSSEEISKFINSISLEKINEFKNKPKKEDLFK